MNLLLVLLLFVAVGALVRTRNRAPAESPSKTFPEKSSVVRRKSYDAELAELMREVANSNGPKSGKEAA